MFKLSNFSPGQISTFIVQKSLKTVKIWYFAYKCTHKTGIRWVFFFFKLLQDWSSPIRSHMQNFTAVAEEMRAPKIVKIWIRNFWYKFAPVRRESL